MITSYFQYNQLEGITLKVNATSDALTDDILWSANSTDTDIKNEKWDDGSLQLKMKTVVFSTTACPQIAYSAFYIDVGYKDPIGGMYSASTRINVAGNDEVFSK